MKTRPPSSSTAANLHRGRRLLVLGCFVSVAVSACILILGMKVSTHDALPRREYDEKIAPNIVRHVDQRPTTTCSLTSNIRSEKALTSFSTNPSKVLRTHYLKWTAPGGLSMENADAPSSIGGWGTSAMLDRWRTEMTTVSKPHSKSKFRALIMSDNVFDDVPCTQSVRSSSSAKAGKLVSLRIVIGLQHTGKEGDERAYSEQCRSYLETQAELPPFTEDDAVRSLSSRVFGPDWFEANVLVEHSGSSRSGFSQPLMFAFSSHRCLYVSTTTVNIALDAVSLASVVVMVDHLHEGWNALRETMEEGHYDYVLRRLEVDVPRGEGLMHGNVHVQWDTKEEVGKISLPPSGEWRFPSCAPSNNTAVSRSSPHAVTLPEGYTSSRVPAPRVWMSNGADPIRAYHTSHLRGYWLTYKTMQWSDYDRVPTYRYDYLGRMNFGLQYAYDDREDGGSDCVSALQQPTGCRTSECILELLRNRVVYFFGDSHMRIFFYGFLTRLGVAYPLDKVWRGDRTDVISSHNVTVKFIASYFLNFSRPNAEGMMRDTTDPIIIAGVGQHHSCHCWSVKKHMTVVDEALRVLTTSPLPRHVVWFGVPAQPYNTHLYRKKPVGQSRKDCRNNARHVVYSVFHHAAIAARNAELKGTAGDPKGRQVWLIDAFQQSLGMQHTSLDGAHYYTWAREAWIDSLVDISYRIAQRKKKNIV